MLKLIAQRRPQSSVLSPQFNSRQGTVKANCTGFSLVELSIVLVILGLLTGGILTGQSLIRAAELRSVITDIQRYQTAIYTFQDKYFAIPGDMKNATDFWGVAAGTGSDAACFAAVSTDGTTCNGNGDGQIIQWNEEGYRAWQHLANTGLIEGNYQGAGTGAIIGDGKAAPTIKISTGAILLTSFTSSTYTTTINKNNLVIGSRGSSGVLSTGALLTAEETWGIDKKIDDGKAGYGALQSRTGSASASGNCVTGTYPNLDYELTNTGIACSMYLTLR